VDDYEQLRYLLDLAESAGIDIRRAPAGVAGDGPGGGEHPGGALVKLKGKEILFLDPAASVADRIAVAAAALAGRADLQDRYLPPQIRDLLDSD
jgi:hypothetical protein